MVPTAPTVSPQITGLRGFHCAALRRLQEDSKSDKDPASSTSTSFHEHYQASHAEQEPGTTSSQEAPGSDPVSEEAPQPNTRSGHGHGMLMLHIDTNPEGFDYYPIRVYHDKEHTLFASTTVNV